MQGFLTLFRKELVRFWKVSFQTVAAPVLTALMYQLIFSHVMSRHVEAYPGVSYTAFLIPGLAMMSMAQCICQQFIQPDSVQDYRQYCVFAVAAADRAGVFAAYMLAAIVRGLAVGAGVLVVTAWFGLPCPAILVGAVVRYSGLRRAGHAGGDCRYLGRKIRSTCCVPELFDHAADFPVWRVLFD
jgi:ABC-2 type transport system permease protein